MIIYLILFFFTIAYFLIPHLRLIVNHPLISPVMAVIDLYNWIIHKGYNNCPTGEMVCFAAHFGGGKTLSAVHRIRKLYKRYNDKKVWDRKNKEYLTQKIQILSNVEFTNIPYEKLTDLTQVVNYAYVNKDIDQKYKTHTVTLVLIDEASVQLNSRNFKSNIDPDFLNTLLTSRHYHMNMYYTSQKFNLTDKLLRDVTQTVIECKKLWRLQVQYTYDGTELENSPRNTCKPKRKGGFFIRNKDYAAYDTLAVVDTLKKSVDSGDMLSEAEILALRMPNSNGMDIDIKSRKSWTGRNIKQHISVS